MKKVLIILSFGVFSLVSCQKDVNLPQNTEGVYTDEIEEIDDAYADETETAELDERGAKPLVITSIEPLNPSDLSPYYDCGKWSYKSALPINENNISALRIKGIGFGEKDSNALKLFIRGKEVPLYWNPNNYSTQIWKDTQILAMVSNLGTYTRNNTLKFQIIKNINGKTYKAVKSKMSLGKIGGWASRNQIMDITNATNDVWYGSALWEIAQQRRLMHPEIPNVTYTHDEQYKFVTIKLPISEIYTPQYGDALRVGDRFGFVRSVSTAADRNGYYTIEVYERNIKCTGTRQKKKYKFKNGAFVQRPNETTVWTHYYR